MKEDLPDDFPDLLEQLLDGSLEPPGRKRLLAHLRENPSLLPLVSTHLAVSRGLADLHGPSGLSAEAAAAHIARIAREPAGEFSQKVRQRIVRRRALRGLAAAAAFVMSAFLVYQVGWRPPETATTDQPHVAEVAAFVRMDGEENEISFRGRAAVGTRFTEATGILRFEFDNGAVVAIEAPSDFTVVSGMEIRLDSGRLNAWCPETAHGFKVRTNSAALTDLGTSFGIHATPKGSEFVVLDGLVEVEQSGRKVRLTEGNALQAAPSDSLNPVAFAPADFRKTWALAYGILATRGAAVPPNPDVLEKLTGLEDDDNLLVIPEKREVPFNVPIRADVIGPGTLPGDFDGKIHTLRPVPGKKLSSFIIRYNPVGTFGERHFKRFEGEVTFDRPVLAIAGQRGVLAGGDAMFSTGKWSDKFRGIELVQHFNPPDSVTLSADRRTVKVVFYAGASTDDIRVILEDN